MSGQGHNTDAGGKLRSFIERVERLDEEIKGLNADKSEVYKEAKGEGYDVKVMRKVVAARKMDSDERDEQDALFDMYWNAIHGVSEEAPHVRAHVHVHEEPNPVAKASEDNGATGEPEHEVAADSVTGDASRPSVGGGTDAPNYQPAAIKPPPSDEDLEIPEFLRRDDGYARSAQ